MSRISEFFLKIFQKKSASLDDMALKESRAFLDSLIENLPNMVFVKDAKELRFVRFNKAGEDLLGYSRSELIGKNDFDFFPHEQAEFFISKDRAVLAGSQIVDIAEEAISTKCNGVRVLHTKKIPLFGKDGNPEYLLGISEDITEKVKADQERMKISREQAAIEERERANQRSAFLAEASTTLAFSLNYQETLKKLAKLTVPALADWCTITILKEDGTFNRVAAIHKDTDKSHLIAELTEKYPAHGNETGPGSIITSGKSQLTEYITDEQLVAAAKDDRHLEIMKTLGSKSCMLIPISGHGKVHGVIALISGESMRLYQKEDVALAEELGRRAGIAIDNAILYEKAQKAIQVRDEFLSIASHELKTPITALKLQLQLTRRSVKPDKSIIPTPEKLAQVLDSSTLQVDRLTALVEDLLDVSKIQAGKLSLKFEKVDLEKVIAEVQERFLEEFEKADCSVWLEVKKHVSGFWDRTRIEQILINLISNAIKYAPGTAIVISIDQKSDPKGESALLSVRDEGPGIPEHMLGKVFDKFERVTASRNISGLGLGLFIVKQIVLAHKGTVQVKSKVGEGTTFIVELPLLSPLTTADAHSNSSQSSKN